MFINRKMDKADLVHIYSVFHYSAIEKIELMAIAAIWLDLQIVMLNEMSQTEKDRFCLTHGIFKTKKGSQIGGCQRQCVRGGSNW